MSYANSGDLPIGERERVVGYGAVVLAAGLKTAKAAARAAGGRRSGGPSRPPDKKALLALARETISRYLTMQMVPLPRGFRVPPRWNRAGSSSPSRNGGTCAAASAG